MPDSLPRDLTVAARLPWPRTRRSRWIEVAALVSLALHAALLGSFWLWMRHKKPVVLVPANSPPVVQLVMSPAGGKPNPAPAPHAPALAVRAAKPAPHPEPRNDHPAQAAKQTQAVKAKVASAAPASPKTVEVPAAKLPPPVRETQAQAEPKQTNKPAPAPAPPPQPDVQASVTPDDQLSINLPQAESDTNAWVTGNDVLPPTADVKFHNRKPSYPAEAALRDEQGAVALLVHVGADGLVQMVSVLRSSGFPALDRAAIDAVRTWHFLPSIRDGQPVPADMPMRFVFELD